MVATVRRRNQNTQRIVTGDAEIDAKLAAIVKKSVANRIARAGLSAAVRVLVKSIKSQVDPGNKSVRKSIGGNVKLATGGVVRARAGAAVGSKKNAVVERTGQQRGRGMSPRNIHWYVLGTAERKHDTTGHPTGKMPSHPIVKDGATAGMTSAQSALKQSASAAFDREMAKLGK